MASTRIVSPVTRIEGHARILLDLDDAGEVARGHLEVWELRGFEKLLQGTELFKMPQVTARLCGVCPAAHHLAAVHAIEAGLGIDPPADAKLLRELLYAGHVLHSHALSTFVLAGPDLVVGIGAPPQDRNVFAMLKINPELVKKVLRLRSIGQRTVELVGGRGVHPVTAVPGGVASRPDKERLELIAGWGNEAVSLIEEIGAVVRERLAQLEELRLLTQLPYHSLALSRGGQFDFFGGECVVMNPVGVVERGFAAASYADHLVEHAMPGSYMKSVRLRSCEEPHFLVGPLARLNVNTSLGTPKADAALRAFRNGGHPHLSALEFIPARLIEMLHCAERMQAIAGGELGDGPLKVEAVPGEGRFVGLIEAPRGILIHDYETDAAGRVAAVNFIVATQNNYDAIDYAITALARHYAPINDDNLLMNGVEFALRCFDPCLACATHATGRMPMQVVLRRGRETVRTIERGGLR